LIFKINFKVIAKQDQHIVPAVYLKHFATESFVHLINYADPYRKNIQRQGIRAKVFCKPNYYDWRSTQLEKYFSRLESWYDKIVDRLTTGQSIGIETKHWITQWMHMSKMRSELVRDIYTGLFTNVERFSHGYVLKADEMQRRENEFVERGNMMGKIFQLQNFLTNDYDETFKQYGNNFMNKEWIVYTSINRKFITSDNPGFSFVPSERRRLLKLPMFTRDYALGDSGYIAHYFPLSSHMCLFLKSLPWHDEARRAENEKDIGKDIHFETASNDIVDDINNVTHSTRNKMVIANDAKDLQSFISETF
jgi:hypothetical protein